MDISFQDKALRKCANSDRLAIRKLGPKRADLFKQRLDELAGVDCLEGVRNLPGHYHELTGNRKGQWACNLDHPYRLVFVPHEEPIPEDGHGRYLWIEIKGVEIVEITNYHKER